MMFTTMPGFSFFPLMGLDNFITVFFMNDFASGIVMKSGLYLSSWRNASLLTHSNNKKGYHEVRREIKSCTRMKVGFGSANYIDHLTPFVMEDFCINQTLSLILLSSSN
jgi:hypothetical protein